MFNSNQFIAQVLEGLAVELHKQSERSRRAILAYGDVEPEVPSQRCLRQAEYNNMEVCNSIAVAIAEVLGKYK